MRVIDVSPQAPGPQVPVDAGRGAGFRPDIEGLRAVAILLVIAFHANVAQLPGGFTGVDVFFVVSGFLITGLIVREIGATGRIDLVSFYARRARRLLPAALLVIALTLLASYFLMPPLRMPSIAADGAAAALYVSNIRFAAQATDYLQADLAPSPLLHYWSLGVEEQFYLFWPALLAIVAVIVRRPAAIAIAIAIAGVASFVYSLWLTADNAPLAFFLLPSRAWELAVGGMIAVAGSRIRLSPFSAQVLGVAGLVAVVASGVVLSSDMAFPGIAAVLPVVGAAMLLIAGTSATPSMASRALSTRPMRYVGRISYSLYLWHWPLLVIPAAALGSQLGAPAVIALVALTFVLSDVSQRYVEEPIRANRALKSAPRSSLAIAGAGSLVVALTALTLFRGPSLDGVAAAGASLPPLDLPGEPSAASRDPGVSAEAATPTTAPEPTTAGGPVPEPLRSRLQIERSMVPRIFKDGCHDEATDVVVGECVYGDPTSPVSVFLIGDSHAAQWFPTLEALATTHRWRLVSLTKGSCPIAAIQVWSPSLKRASTECDDWREKVVDRIKAEHPALVVVSNSRVQRLMVDGKPIISQEHEPIWIDALRTELRELQKDADRVVLIGDTPNPKNDPPDCLSQHLDDMLACTNAKARSTNTKRARNEDTLAESIGVTWIDPTDWVCPTDPCPVVIDGYLVYRDSGHIATSFATALAPYVDTMLPNVPDG